MNRLKTLFVNFKFFLQSIGMRNFLDNLRYMYYSDLLVITNNDNIYLKLHKLNLSFLYNNIISKKEISTFSFTENKSKVKEYYIWTLWWQGYNQMPDIIKATINSIKQATDKKVIIIDKNNISKYIQVPDYIEIKMKNGKIGLPHFSDYIRVALLSKYGGLWIDSTILCVQPIPQYIFKEEFFTIKADPITNKYIPRGKWNMQILGSCNTNCPIFVFMKKYLELYWQKYDKAINYLFFDYGMQMQYANNSISKALIDNVKKSNPRMHQLRDVINQPFNKTLWKELTQNDTWIYKLTYKDKFINKIDSQETLYTYIIRLWK